MNDLTPAAKLNLPDQPKLANKVRFVTAASVPSTLKITLPMARKVTTSSKPIASNAAHSAAHSASVSTPARVSDRANACDPRTSAASSRRSK